MNGVAGTPRAEARIALRRIAAFFVDWLLIVTYALLAFVALAPLVRGAFVEPGKAELAGFLILTLPVVLYFSVCEAAAGRTVGKRLVGLAVVARDGGRLPAGRAVVRNVTKFVPWELGHFAVWHAFAFPGGPLEPAAYAALVACYVLAAVYGVGLFVGGRTLYDLVAGSRVVRTTATHDGTGPARGGANP